MGKLDTDSDNFNPDVARERRITAETEYRCRECGAPGVDGRNLCDTCVPEDDEE